VNGLDTDSAVIKTVLPDRHHKATEEVGDIGDTSWRRGLESEIRVGKFLPKVV